MQEKLQRFARGPVSTSVRSSHQRRIAAAAAVPQRRGLRRFGALWVAGAGLIGFTIGSTGLAAAGALPDPAQNVAHDVLGAVRVDVPAGKEGKRGPCVSQAAKIEDEAAKQAAKDACPKGGPPEPPDNGAGTPEDPGSSPGKSGEAPGHSGDRGHGKGTDKHAGDPCRGRPPWAGRMTQEEKAAAKASASRENCPADDDTDGPEANEANASATEATVPAIPTESTVDVSVAPEPSAPSSVPESSVVVSDKPATAGDEP